MIPLAIALWLAAAPANTDPHGPIADWFQSLRVPDTGAPCCSVADCRVVTWRQHDGKLQAFIGRKNFGPEAPDDWVDVPPESVLRRIPNPMGSAVACWYGGQIRCFVWGTLS